jgi:hypothetical protein
LLRPLHQNIPDILDSVRLRGEPEFQARHGIQGLFQHALDPGVTDILEHRWAITLVVLIIKASGLLQKF